ncbi:neutral alpha-glucosidase AB-like isoform X1 [Artemia franciscana]|uniref:neutral alpha-glucosidase AB-like isoform X1 n=1 Tax=Artemia franciscana TaxID=6661 RepID=UPI0032DB4D9A
MRLNRNCLFFILSFCYVKGVDKGNFKSCEQSSFCKRHRATRETPSAYIADLKSLSLHKERAFIDVINVEANIPLTLEIIALHNYAFRIKIQEKNGLRKRYQVENALVREPETAPIILLEKKDDHIVLGLDAVNRMVIQGNPFRLDLFNKNGHVITMNGRGMFKFEHYRTRKTLLGKAISKVAEVVGSSGSLTHRLASWIGNLLSSPEEIPMEHNPETDSQIEPLDAEEVQQTSEEPPAEVPVNNDAEETEPGMWEEDYKSHHDSKPYGPSSFGVDLSFPGSNHVYGIPEHADSLALRDTLNGDPYRLYNLDVFEYELWSPMALYGAIPFVMAKGKEGAVGVYWQNAAETWVDVRDVPGGGVVSSLMKLVSGGASEPGPHKEVHFISESGLMDVFFLLGPGPKDVLQQYTGLTGVTPLPQMFAIAYHQCRWNYNDQEDVQFVHENFDKEDMPLDVIWLDIEHTDNKKYFTWDPIKFSDSLGMMKNLSDKGRKLVTIVDPHIKRDSNYFIHKDCEANGFYIKDTNGKDFEGWCWPGSSSYPDFFNPAVREYWKEQYAFDKYHGTTKDVYIWNDMNEPSVFNGPEVTMHKDKLHHGGWEHRDVHNIYGMLVVDSTFQGLMARGENKLRPFILSRSFFAGSQRYGAIWTGDNGAEWGHLQVSIPMVLSLSIAGMAFTGGDVGGFFKNPETDLLIRWYQAGAYQPFFRAHAHEQTRRREPYLYDETTKDIIRQAIRQRYALLPYWYTLFYENEKTGIPPMRPLWLEYPKDSDTFALDDVYLLGDSLLVRPVTESKATSVKVYFPSDESAMTIWYDVETYETFTGRGYKSIEVDMYKIPVFQRGGSIIPKKLRPRRSSVLMQHDPYTLVVALDEEGKASGTLYIDDGESFDYREGKYVYGHLDYQRGKLSFRFLDAGRYSDASWVERIIVAGLRLKPHKIFAQIQGTKDHVELDFKYEAKMHILTIRKPKLPMNYEWHLQFY